MKNVKYVNEQASSQPSSVGNKATYAPLDVCNCIAEGVA